MYANTLLDAYKDAQKYIQDKQIAHDLNLTPQKISKIRKGERYISDSEAIFLAERAGIDPKLALIGCHADRNENPSVKQLWETIAKKFDGHGLHLNSIGYVGLTALATMPFLRLSEYALCILC